MHYHRTINRYLPVLDAVPYSRAFFVAGSVAKKTTTKDSDVDLVVYAKKNRVWLNRILMTITITLVGRRRTKKKRADRFCLNATIAEGEAKNIVSKIHPKLKIIKSKSRSGRVVRTIFELVLEATFLGPILDFASQKILEGYIRRKFSFFGQNKDALLILRRNLVIYHPPR